MNGTSIDRAATVLGAAAVVSVVFHLGTGPNDHFVLVRGGLLVVLPVLGLVAVAGGLLRQPVLVLAAGAGFAAAAVLQLVQLGRDTNWLDGNGSTFSLLLGLAIGLLVLGGQAAAAGRS